MLADVIAGCATPGYGRYTSRWYPDAAPQSIEVRPGLRLRYLKVGTGRPLVLLHTIRTQLDYFQKVIPLLKAHFTVYAVDLPGHGQSSISDVDYGERFFRGAITQFIEELDLHDATLAGESIGGVLALTVATEVPARVSSVISINPYDGGDAFGGSIRRSASGWIVGFFSVFGRYTLETRYLLNKVLVGGLHNPDRLPQDLVNELFRTGQRLGYRRAESSVFAQWRTWREARQYYAQVRVPVTLVYSDEDWSTPAERQHNRAALPGARSVLIERAGHFASLDQPERVAEAIVGGSAP